MATQTQSLVKAPPKDMEFEPFGSKDKIKLSVAIVQNLIAEVGDDGVKPGERDCMRFMMLCRSRRLNPFEGDAFLVRYGSRWNLITAHSAFLKRAEPHPEYNGKKSGIIVFPPLPCKPCEGTGRLLNIVCPACDGKGHNDEIEGDFMPDTNDEGEPLRLVGGWCKVFYKTRNVAEHQRLKLSTYNKGVSVWKNDPAGMICKCAEAAALRSAFPTTLGGLYLREEMTLMGGDSTVKAPVFEPTVEPKPAGPAPETAEETEKPSVVKTIRDNAKAGKIKEPEILHFLIETGCVPEGTGSLEEVALKTPDIADMLVAQWADVSSKIMALRAA